jgi:2-polyprenyl-3-methyl-5-hydroxy-6-metoxy-1,4-benzoquinol methylase
MNDETRKKWDAIYGTSDRAVGEPARVLAENHHLLPRHGKALEVACGRGANALFLAAQGLETWAWDISTVAIESLAAEAQRQGYPLHTQTRDVMQAPPEGGSFDVIVVSHFLERGLIALLRQALRPQGLLYYQTFTRARVSERGPSNAEFRLQDNELLRLCEGMRILVYREEGLVGDTTQGFRDLACVVAQNP